METVSDEHGSFLVLGVFFTIIFLMVGGLAVDVSRYLVLKQKLQQAANGAALAGGRALNQYADEPELEPAYLAVLDYLADHFGEEYLDLYGEPGSGDYEGIEIKKIEKSNEETDDYRVGVVVYGVFQPYFFPDRFLSERLTGTYRLAVAETYYDPRRRVEYEPMNCGMVVDGELTLSGNNFNQNIEGQPANLCANADINAGGSANGVLGDIYTAGDFVPPGGGHGLVRTGEPVRENPEFLYNYPEHSDYDVELSDTTFETWDPCGGAASRPAKDFFDPLYSIFRPSDALAQPPHAGPPGGGETKELTTKDGEYVGVCVNRSEKGKFNFEQGTELVEGEMQTGDSIGIYVEGSLNFVRNSKVHGGIYATGDITVESNNNDFIGNPDKLGGLSLWADGDVKIHMNNVKIEGLTGAGGNYEFTGPPFGGGNISGFRGVLISGDSFESSDNSANTRFQYDPELVDYNALDMKDWEEAVHIEVKQPPYTQISVRLIS